MTMQQNRFNSLKEELQQNRQIKTLDKHPALLTKNNRFNFTESEMQPKDKNIRDNYGNRCRQNFRDRDQFERELRAKEEFVVAERKKLELQRTLTDTSSFPDLVSYTQTLQHNPNELNFLEKVNLIEYVKPIEWNNGLDIIKKNGDTKPDRKQIRVKTPHEIMAKQVELYDNWKAKFIAEYDEEYYEKYYRFPNYDYDYFDNLDEKYEAELRELERLEEEKDEEQYIEYNNHNESKHKKYNDI